MLKHSITIPFLGSINTHSLPKKSAFSTLKAALKKITLLYILLCAYGSLSACSSAPQHLSIEEASSYNRDSLARRVMNRNKSKPQNSHRSVRLSSSRSLNANDSETLLEVAHGYLGTSYRYGGNDYNGIDCSGLVVNSFDAININMPRTSMAQSELGEFLSDHERRKGDLVFFSTDGDFSSINHVGILLDEYSFIHSSSSRGVIVSQLSNPYWKRNYKFTKRVIR